MHPSCCEHLPSEECFACVGEAANREALASYVYGATDSPIRTFATGATRGSEDGKLDPEGFLSPLVVVRYSEYMQKHRTQADGTMRASDNWQKGMPLVAYMKSMWRHFLDVWLLHRQYAPVHQEPGYDMEEALCAMIFNCSGYLDTILRDTRD
jgi:hypothetical protein